MHKDTLEIKKFFEKHGQEIFSNVAEEMGFGPNRVGPVTVTTEEGPRVRFRPTAPAPRARPQAPEVQATPKPAPRKGRGLLFMLAAAAAAILIFLFT